MGGALNNALSLILHNLLEVIMTIKSIFEKVIGSYSSRELKRIYPLVDEIEKYEEPMRALTDDQLKAKTPEFKQRLEKRRNLG